MLIENYNKEEAIHFILKRIYETDYPLLGSQLKELLANCIDADFAYMLENDILRKDGEFGENYYNNRAASEYILVSLIRQHHMNKAQAEELLTLIDDYMDFNRSYLEHKKLKYHVDENLSPYGW